MSAVANPVFALRPYLPEDTPVLAEIFRASIEGLAADDYSEAQIDAWAAAAADEAEFAARLGARLTLIATLEGSPVGFAAVELPHQIDLLFVHPAAAGQGAGSLLMVAVEKLASARGANKLTVDASDNALEFFRRRGFSPTRRNSVPLGGEWFSSTTMEKPLGAAKVGK